MVIDFSKLDYSEDPVLLLKNLDGTIICPLSFAQEVSAELMYNEVSELEFRLPKRVNGFETPHYDDVVGMRIVDWVGVGQFILVDPKEQTDGIEEYKECSAYSLEYELNNKQLYMEEGTYDFWNPVAQENTVIGIILSLLPAWSVGTIDDALWGKYRTFGVENETVYDFIKNTAQETYQCIFDFDTYERKINVRAASSIVASDPVYLSLDNLIKERTIEEDTENIYTCLDVNGAEDVDIRSVNPMGTNKIYNLSYFMERGYFTDEMKDKWEGWQQTYQDHKQLYYNVTIEKVLQESRLETEKAALTRLDNELSQLETMRSTYIEANSQGLGFATELAQAKKDITAKEAEIATKKALVESIADEIDALLQQQIIINKECAFSAFFSDEEQKILDLHFKENSISEESFVYQTVSSYTAEDIAQLAQVVTAKLSGGTVTKVTNTSGKDVFANVGGQISMKVDDKDLSAKVVRAAVECKTDGSYILTAYLNSGSYDGASFPSGCISLTGSGCTVTSNVKADPDIQGSYKEGSEVSISSATSNLYFTVNATEYAKRSVEWDLMEYGEQQLEKLSYPSYTFSIDSSNFLALEDFLQFKNNFHLGNRVYLEMGDGEVRTPIVIGAEVEMDDPSKLKLTFSDTYSALDNAFEIVDLLDKAISMGKKVSANALSYSAFVDSGASTSVRDFINSALDFSKNKILSTGNQKIQIDDSGITLRKWDEQKAAYDPMQIKMINGSIVFTTDNWETVNLAIGQFFDERFSSADNENGQMSGIVAQAIVGTLLAGTNLVIESEKKDGGVAVFRVDADGCRLYNSRFDLVNEYSFGSSGQISLIPDVGFVGGKTTSTTPLFSYDENGNVNGVLTAGGNTLTSAAKIDKDDLPNANWYMDVDGNAYFKGTVYATDGQFSGVVYARDGEFTGKVTATSGEFSGTIKASKLEGDLVGAGGQLKGVSLGIGGTNYNNFVVDSNGNVTMNGNINLSGGNITWGSNLPESDGLTEDEVVDLIDENQVKLPSYVQSTSIDFSTVQSPKIIGNEIITNAYFAVTGNVGGLADYMGYMGAAYGVSASNSPTYGVALSYGDPQSLGTTSDKYLIVTDGGVRMQAPGHSIVVTSKGCYADGELINSGSGGTGGTAVFG